MPRAHTIAFYSLIVRFGRIALVACPAIARVLLMELAHTLVAIGLGKHRGSGNAHILAVALHHAGVGQIRLIIEPVAIYQVSTKASFIST